MSQCIHDVARWTCSNRLQLNAQKTELIWCVPARRRHRIPSGDVQVGQDSVHPVQSARNLGVYVDGALTMRTHITDVLSSCYSALRQIRSIMPSVFTRAKRSRHFYGSQPVGLLQRCLRRSSSLRHSATTVSAQHSCTFGGRLIST